jgi:oxygen-dependent protoporphyrinogen oxidase
VTAPDAVDTVIIGGGIAGLTTAYDLHQRGVGVLLIEGAPQLGGLIRTERVGELTLEVGPDALLVAKPAAIDLCRAVGLGEALVSTTPPRTAFVLRHGRLHAIPRGSVLGLPQTPEAIARARMLSAGGRLRLATGFFRPRWPEGNEDVSIGAFLRARFGSEVVSTLAQPLLGGIHAGDIDRLSLPALFPGLPSRLTPLASRKTRYGEPDPDGAFRSLRGGLGMLVDALARTFPPSSVRLGEAATAIARAPSVEGSTVDAAPFVVALQGEDVVRARAVVLATPAWAAARLLATLDAPLATFCGEIPYASTATITLAYPRDAVAHPLRGTGFVVPRGQPETRLLAATWVTSKWPGRAPPNIVLLRAFAGGTLDLDLAERDEPELVRLAHHDLSRLLGIRAAPSYSRVDKWPRASPQYEVGHLQRVQRIDQRLGQFPGLFLTGSGFRGVGIPDSVKDAREVARHVHAWLARFRGC